MLVGVERDCPRKCEGIRGGNSLRYNVKQRGGNCVAQNYPPVRGRRKGANRGLKEEKVPGSWRCVSIRYRCLIRT